MSTGYTDEDVQAARKAGDRAAEIHQPTALHRAGQRSRWGCTCHVGYGFRSRDEQAAHIAMASDLAVLDAVVPAIVRRAKAEALREAAAEFASRTQEAAGQVRTHWRGQDFVDGQDTAYERASEWLENDADLIERGQS